MIDAGLVLSSRGAKSVELPRFSYPAWG